MSEDKTAQISQGEKRGFRCTCLPRHRNGNIAGLLILNTYQFYQSYDWRSMRRKGDGLHWLHSFRKLYVRIDFRTVDPIVALRYE